MPLWDTEPVRNQPELVIECWAVIRVEGDWHLVGYVPQNQEGRVSSRIRSFDAGLAVATTATGRVYRMRGANGLNEDARYVLDAWLSRYGITEFEEITQRALDGTLRLEAHH